MTITFEKLCSGEFEAVAADHKFLNKVTLFKSGGESSLPRVSFSWEVRHYLSLSADEASQLDTPHVQTSQNGGNFVWAREVRKGETVQKHVTLCNFRRYGWVWASGFNAEYSYCTGPIYANRDDGGVSATSPEQIVRDTLIAALGMSVPSVGKIPGGLKSSVYAREALEWLLQDALNNMSDHANPKAFDYSKDWDIRHGVTSEVVD